MSVLGRRGASQLRSLTVSGPTCSACALRPFSVLNRPSPNYPGHVPLTTIERGALAVGSAIGSLINPRRAGMSLQLCKEYHLLRLVAFVAMLALVYSELEH